MELGTTLLVFAAFFCVLDITLLLVSGRIKLPAECACYIENWLRMD
jgi:hypothetical protein